MNKPVIIDSSAFISLTTTADGNYKKASLISNQILEEDKTIIMPGEVFTEIVNVTGKKINHQTAIGLAKKILSSKVMHIEESTSKIRQKALDEFEKQPESVSFTDCIAMAFADEFETKEIFGFDEVFR